MLRLPRSGTFSTKLGSHSLMQTPSAVQGTRQAKPLDRHACFESWRRNKSQLPVLPSVPSKRVSQWSSHRAQLSVLLCFSPSVVSLSLCRNGARAPSELPAAVLAAPGGCGGEVGAGKGGRAPSPSRSAPCLSSAPGRGWLNRSVSGRRTTIMCCCGLTPVSTIARRATCSLHLLPTKRGEK